MLINLYRNTVAAIMQWIETMQFNPAPVPVKIRIKTSDLARATAARQRRGQ